MDNNSKIRITFITVLSRKNCKLTHMNLIPSSIIDTQPNYLNKVSWTNQVIWKFKIYLLFEGIKIYFSGKLNFVQWEIYTNGENRLS